MENLLLDDDLTETQSQQPENYQIASSGKRFGNYLIDMIVVYILSFLAGVIYVISFGASGMNTLTSYVIGILVIVSYYTFLESINGKSIGKMITGTRVLNEDFSKPSLGTLFKRSWCRIIPFEPFSFLGSTSGWHDSITETVVVID